MNLAVATPLLKDTVVGGKKHWVEKNTPAGTAALSGTNFQGSPSKAPLCLKVGLASLLGCGKPTTVCIARVLASSRRAGHAAAVPGGAARRRRMQ
jgi:hypothetical protein